MRERIAILALAALLSVPAYAGAWGAKGSLEPDTALDRTGGYQWGLNQVDTSNTGAVGHKVYFNAYVYQSADSHFDHGIITVNPNFASVGMEHQGWMGQITALLGVWKDCNKDGYIGLGDNAVLEYRAELLLDTSVCPKQTPGASLAPMHNDGAWIHEYIPLGPEAAAIGDNNPMDLSDNGARVWMDWGVPGAAPAPSRCYIFMPSGPDPAGHPQWGAMHTTGGMLAWADCWDDYGTTDKINTVATGPLSSLSFSDHPRDQWNSSSALNRPNPWGYPGSASAVTVWDCNSPAIVPYSTTGTPHQVSAPKVPPTANAGGSIAGTLEATVDGVIDCNAATDPPSSGGGKNQYSYAVAYLPYSQESSGFSDASGVKSQADFLFQYNEGNRPAPAFSNVVGRTGPKDAGLSDAGDSDGLWIGTQTISEDRNPYVDRNALGDPVTRSPFQPAQYMTSYAFISATTITQYGLILGPSGKVGTYGQEACAGAPSGIGPTGWQCDGSLWYGGNCDPNLGYACTGLVHGVTTDISIRPGQLYQLRDVDCYDNSVSAARAQGISYGVLTGTACV